MKDGGLAETLAVVRAIAPNATVVVRGDSKFYTAQVATTAARYDAFVSLTTGSNPSITAVITSIGQDAWRAIRYPDAFVDTETGELISDAEVAEIPYTAFTSRPKREQVHGRLIVLRVKRRNPDAVKAAQDQLFTTWRHHVVFITSPFQMLQAEGQYRDHAIVEQVIADAAVAHWRTCLGVLQREPGLGGAVGDRAQPHPRRRDPGQHGHARATTATIRAHLINVPAGSPAGPAPDPAPARRLATGSGLDRTARCRPPISPAKA